METKSSATCSVLNTSLRVSIYETGDDKEMTRAAKSRMSQLHAHSMLQVDVETDPKGFECSALGCRKIDRGIVALGAAISCVSNVFIQSNIGHRTNDCHTRNGNSSALSSMNRRKRVGCPWTKEESDSHRIQTRVYAGSIVRTFGS